MAEVALAWVMARPGVTSTLIGARTRGQIESNIAAAEITLSAEQMARLEVAGTQPTGFGASLTQPAIRRMVFGGQNVAGWKE